MKIKFEVEDDSTPIVLTCPLGNPDYYVSITLTKQKNMILTDHYDGDFLFFDSSVVATVIKTINNLFKKHIENPYQHITYLVKVTSSDKEMFFGITWSTYLSLYLQDENRNVITKIEIEKEAIPTFIEKLSSLYNYVLH